MNKEMHLRKYLTLVLTSRPLQTSNWIPTLPGKRFFLLFRFYGPERAVFDKSWQLPDMEEVK